MAFDYSTTGFSLFIFPCAGQVAVPSSYRYAEIVVISLRLSNTWSHGGGAIIGKYFTAEQIMTEIEGILA